MEIDWDASKNAWIEDMRSVLMPRLCVPEFPDANRLIARFEAAVVRWRNGERIHQLIHDGNELCAATALLGTMKPGDKLLYEPRLATTKKSIDFCIEAADGTKAWFDMKTVAPQWQDDEEGWQRFLKIAKGFPDDAKLIVSQEWSGAAISGQALKARWTFVTRTSEVEAKAELLSDQERGPVRLLLCSNGSWHKDELEDFADFYRTNAFRADDWARNAISHYMAKDGIAFKRTLAGFCYLGRGHEDVSAKFTMDVRGPTLFGPTSNQPTPEQGPQGTGTE